MFKDKLKKLIGNEENSEGPKNQKKKIENLMFFIIILIVTIIAINLIWNDNNKEKETQNDETKKLAITQKSSNNETIETSSSNDLEEKLEKILSTIQGVGEVHVFINYSESSEVIPMYNENSKTSTTEETDTEGGVRKIQETDTQKDVIYQENDGEKVPITQKTIKPKIEGAIITAKGASDANVKTNIIQAVEAVTGLATHKIQVFEMQ